MNWRGRPLVSLAAVVSLIAATRSATGLHVRSELDRRRYAAGLSVSDAHMRQIARSPHRFHGEWNYTIHPKRRKSA